jgi:hypothetical protein
MKKLPFKLLLILGALLLASRFIDKNAAHDSMNVAEISFQERSKELVSASNTVYASNHSDIAPSAEQMDFLATSVRQIGASNGNIVIDKPVSLAANLTVPGNIKVVCRKSGEITTNGHTIKINGSFEAGPYECFIAQPGEVLFGAASITNVLPQWFGAAADGITECAAALRTACASLPNGGQVILPDGSYYLNSYDQTLMSEGEYVTFKVPSNVALQCREYRSAKLKCSPALQGALPAGTRINIIGTPLGTSGQTIKNLEFDFDGIVLDAPFRSYHSVYSLGKNVLLENLYIKNSPGRSMIIVGYHKYNDSTGFNTIRNVTIINGSRNVPGNLTADDASFIYLNGSHNIVENCEFYNETQPVTNCSGVELHCTESSVRNCKFKNLYAAIYVGYERYSRISENIEISNNLFDHCCGGIESVDRTIGMQINYNHFISCNCSGKWAIMTPRDDNTGVARAGIQDNVHITYNSFDGISTIRVAGYQNGTISHNTWVRTNSGIEFAASSTDVINMKITNNSFVDPVAHTSFDQGQVFFHGYGKGNLVGRFENIIIENNKYQSDTSKSPPSHQYPVLATGNENMIFKNIVVKNIAVVNMIGKVSGNRAKEVAFIQ